MMPIEMMIVNPLPSILFPVNAFMNVIHELKVKKKAKMQRKSVVLGGLTAAMRGIIPRPRIDEMTRAFRNIRHPNITNLCQVGHP